VFRFTPRRLYFWGNSPWYPLYKGRVGPTAGLDAVTRRKTNLPLPGIGSQSSSPQYSHYTDWAAQSIYIFKLNLSVHVMDWDCEWNFQEGGASLFPTDATSRNPCPSCHLMAGTEPKSVGSAQNMSHVFNEWMGFQLLYSKNLLMELCISVLSVGHLELSDLHFWAMHMRELAGINTTTTWNRAH